jgi:hypothetical protein
MATAPPPPQPAAGPTEPVTRELFAGKAFYIAEGLFKEYEDKLGADIKVSRWNSL